jgi:5'-nucleotidase
MEKVLVDMDEVIADCVGQFLDWYERDFGVLIERSQLVNTHIFDVVYPEHRDVVVSYPHQRGFFRDLAVIEGSQKVVKELSRKYDVYVVSRATEFVFSLEDKQHWLRDHFSFLQWNKLIFCGDKSLIRGDVMIDDHSYNLNGFEGRKILFSAPHNMSVNGFERAKDWLEIGDLLL